VVDDRWMNGVYVMSLRIVDEILALRHGICYDGTFMECMPNERGVQYNGS
jgi:hypothetical protein